MDIQGQWLEGWAENQGSLSTLNTKYVAVHLLKLAPGALNGPNLTYS